MAAPLPDAGRRRKRTAAQLRRAALALLAALLALAVTRHVQQAGTADHRAGDDVDGVAWRIESPAQLPAGFRFNKVVAIIAFDRFEYFRQVIDALRRAWGAREYVVTIWIDGAPEADSSGFDRRGWQDIVAYSQQLQWLARNASFGFQDVRVDVAPANLGVWANKKRGVAGAMSLSDFAVILEDDIVVERDALRWFEWHVTSGLIFARPDIALATCWSTSFPYHRGAVEGHDLLMAQRLGMLDKYWLYSWAQPWGWALWRRTWDALGDEWNGRDKKLGRQIQERGWLGTMPLVARCNNIGSMGAHKKGITEGHVHRRAVTSGSFAHLERCRYTELRRSNYTSPLLYEEMYTGLVRVGLTQDGKHLKNSLDARAAAAEAFALTHLNASHPNSTC